MTVTTRSQKEMFGIAKEVGLFPGIEEERGRSKEA